MPALTNAILTPRAALLGPVIGLNVWHLSMEVWMYVTRIAWFTGSKQAFNSNTTRAQFEASQPPSVRWVADNYNHLFEQPTQFYAVALALAVMGADSKTDVALAWAYVAGRVLHSFVQSLGNHVPTRFRLYILNSLVLTGMTARAGLLLWEKSQ